MKNNLDLLIHHYQSQIDELEVQIQELSNWREYEDASRLQKQQSYLSRELHILLDLKDPHIREKEYLRRDIEKNNKNLQERKRSESYNAYLFHRIQQDQEKLEKLESIPDKLYIDSDHVDTILESLIEGEISSFSIVHTEDFAITITFQKISSEKLIVTINGKKEAINSLLHPRNMSDALELGWVFHPISLTWEKSYQLERHLALTIKEELARIIFNNLPWRSKVRLNPHAFISIEMI